MKKNQLTTTKSTSLILGKSKSLLGIIKKLLQNKAVAATTPKGNALAEHEGITLIGDLVWEKETHNMSWYDAMEYAKNLRLGGYDDWRLPTIEELGEVVTICGGDLDDSDRNEENIQYQEAYKAIGFTFYRYWSSITHDYYTRDAWVVDFESGYTGYGDKASTSLVRCVRQDNKSG